MNAKNETVLLDKKVIDDYSKEEFEKIFFDYRKNQIVTDIKNNLFNYYTDKIAFREFQHTDLFHLFEANKNSQFTANLLWGPFEDFETFLTYGKKLLKSSKDNDCALITVIDKKNGNWIGQIRYTPYKDGVILSLWISPNYFNNFLAIRSVDLTIQLLFEKTSIQKIYCVIRYNYELMKKVLHERNFIEIGPKEVLHENNSYILHRECFLDKDNWKIKNKYKFIDIENNLL